MQDGIIKGNGSSRYLKTVAEALTLYPTYEDFMAALIAGTLPVDLNGINTAGWDTVGTALNKASLLSDATATALGLDTSATPNDALGTLHASLKQKTEGVPVISAVYEGSQIAFNMRSLETGRYRLYVGSSTGCQCVLYDGNSGSKGALFRAMPSSTAWAVETLVHYNGISIYSDVPGYVGDLTVKNGSSGDTSIVGHFTSSGIISFVAYSCYNANLLLRITLSGGEGSDVILYKVS